MKLSTLALTLFCAATAVPASAQVPDEFCTRLFVYTIKQICQLLPNGQNFCQPIALTGPAPGCAVPGNPMLLPVPIGPAVLQSPSYPPPNLLVPTPPVYVAPAVSQRVQATPAPPAFVKSNDEPERVTPPPTPVVVQAEPAPINVIVVPEGVTIVDVIETTPPINITAPIGTNIEKIEPKESLVNFEFDSAQLTPSRRAMLDVWLTQTPDGAPIEIIGHSDRLGSASYNEKLSLYRAEAVGQYLIKKGITPNRIHLLAKGASIPLVHCPGKASPETKACLAPNRRAEITQNLPAPMSTKTLKTANYPEMKASKKRKVKVALPKPAR